LGKQPASPLCCHKLTDGSQEAPESNPLAPHLLVEPEDDRGICHEFLTEAISRFQEDDLARSALVGAVEDLSRQLAKMTMNDNYKSYVGVSLLDFL
jgi:ubiquitin conjugation factor E4 B